MTTTMSLLCAVVGLPASYLAWLWLSPRSAKLPTSDHLPSALIPSYTSHARLLPVPSRHTFSYPLIYLGIDIDAVHDGVYNLPGRLFAYGGSPWTKVLGLRSFNYLTPGPATLRQKLDTLLQEHGMEENDMTKGWMVSMPSLLGFEGINPLTVWYIYNSDRQISCIILEVHNTFGEKHAYVLKTGSEHAVTPNEGYDLAWVFPRTFHVSPFNSRNGFYRLDILNPLPASSQTANKGRQTAPQMKVFLRLLTPDKTVKLTAVVASHPTHKAIPLHPDYALPILFALLRWPFTLVLSTPRILYHAYILQWAKKLAMFPRPEPRMKGQEGVWNPPQNYEDGVGTRMDVCEEGTTERWLRGVIVRWAEKRAEETGMGLKIVFRDGRPSVEIPAIGEAHGKKEAEISDEDSDTELVNLESDTEEKSAGVITLTTSDPSFFVNLVTAPTPAHYLTLSPELLTFISHPRLFTTFFAPKPLPGPDYVHRKAASLRRDTFRWGISHSAITPPPDLYVHSDTHFTDTFAQGDRAWLAWVVYTAHLANWAEEAVMWKIRAKYVEGGEPWKVWERALRRLYRIDTGDKAHGEGWEDLGSVMYT